MAKDITRLVDELAGHWTEPALTILTAAGLQRISVDMEVETWRTLKKVLCAELRWQRSFRFSTLVSLSTLMEQVLRKAMLTVAQKLEPQVVSHEFENNLSRLAGERRATAVERDLYSAAHAAARAPGCVQGAQPYRFRAAPACFGPGRVTLPQSRPYNAGGPFAPDQRQRTRDAGITGNTGELAPSLARRQ